MIGVVMCGLLLGAGCTSSKGAGGSTTTTSSTAASEQSSAPSDSSSATDSTTPGADVSVPATAPWTSTPAPRGTLQSPAFETLPAITTGDPDVRTGSLPNGLTYYIRNNNRPGGSAELRLAVNAGSGRQTAQQVGVAHFLEHMMFNGTTSYPKNDLIDVLRNSGSEFGADINAYTTYDETVYQLDVPTTSSKTLDTGINVLSEWLSAATLDPQEVTKERGVVLDEFRSRSENSDGRTEAALETMFLKGSPYADQAPIGTSDAIQAMSPETLRSFYNAWYRPDNAAVVVIGDVDVDTVMTEIQSRFGGLEPRATAATAAPLTITPSDTGVPGRITDPDLTTRTVELTLPLVAEQPTLTSKANAAADEVIFTMIANRLSDDSKRGDTPFSRAYVADNNLVRPLDAPSVDVEAKTGRTTDSMLALLDEFERANRFGFDAGELKRAIDHDRAQIEEAYQARDTRQDADYADGYATTFLTGSPILAADADHTLSTFILDHMTAAFVDARFAYRWNHAGPYVTVYGPQSEDAALPTLAQIGDALAALPQRSITQRPATDVLSGDLMDPPAPVKETSNKRLTPNQDLYLTPTELDFGNGVTVILDHTDISANEVSLSAVSNGGLDGLPAADVVDGRVAADVVTTSGAGAHDQTQLEQLLSGTTIDVRPTIGPNTDTIDATAATGDVKKMLELIHLYMANPNIDPVALQREIADATSSAADPFADQATAAQAALQQARYGDDERFANALTAADIATIDADGIKRAWATDFGNASGWTFTIVGDLDVAAVSDLVRQYLGSLPSTGSDVPRASITPPPPAGVVVRDIKAGTGDTATLLRLYSTRVAKTVPNHVLADVASGVVSARILKRIREDLGQSYSPSASFYITPADDGGDDFVDLYIEITAAPDQIPAVTAALDAEITDLATKGPTDAEIQAAVAVVSQRYNYINNQQLDGYLLAQHTGIGDTATDFTNAYTDIDRLVAKDVRTYLSTDVPLDRYIEVHALPR